MVANSSILDRQIVVNNQLHGLHLKKKKTITRIKLLLSSLLLLEISQKQVKVESRN
jgi:hypothetical protein